MSQANVELVRSGYEAFRRRDFAAVFQLLDTEVEVYQSEEIPWGGRYRGHTEVQQFFARLTQTIESRVDPDQFIDAGDRIVAVGHSRGTVHATGKAFEVPAVHVWTVRGGKAVRFEAYIDNPAMLRALEPGLNGREHG
jgi:hypothetical protein